VTETRKLLMDAAEANIRQKGYNAVSFRELADDLGIKSASVHYHFRKKEDLGLALITRYSERFFQTLAQNTFEAATAREKLTGFCETYRQALVSSDSICLCGMLGAESCGLPEAMTTKVAGFFTANIAWLENAFPSHWPSADKQSRAGQVVATLQGAMMLATSTGNPLWFRQTATHLIEDVMGP